jgi:hypothetical protein
MKALPSRCIRGEPFPVSRMSCENDAELSKRHFRRRFLAPLLSCDAESVPPKSYSQTQACSSYIGKAWIPLSS